MIAVLSRGAAAVGVASVLVFSLPLSAQAFDVGDAAKVFTLASGGVAAASPGVLGAAAAAEASAVTATAVTCAASIICGGAVLAIAAGTIAYSTRDTWVPWVKEWAVFGGGEEPLAGSWGVQTVCSQVAWGVGSTLAAGPGGASAVAFDMSSTPGQGGACPTGMYADTTVRLANGSLLTRTSLIFSNNLQPGGSVAGPVMHMVIGVADPGEAVVHLVVRPGAGPFGFQYGAGNALEWYPATGVNPATTDVTTNKVCQRPDGSTYTDSRSISNATDYIPVGVCLPGDKAVSLDVVVTPAGGAPIVTQTLPLTPTLADSSAYPLCAAAGCEYQILIDNVPCKVGGVGCTSWAATYAASPARVTGRYGPYEYSPSLLLWLTHAYDSRTGTRIGTTTATGGQEAGEPAPEVGVEPPGLTDPQPIPSDTAGGECWPTGIARWNPGDWVLAPVKCALTWAFVPSTATLTGLVDGVTADVNRTGIPAVVTAIGVPLTSLPAGNAACLGPGVSLPQLGQDAPFHPFSACAEPIKTAAAISYALSTVVIVVGGGLTLMRLAGAGFGFNVAVKGGGS